MVYRTRGRRKQCGKKRGRPQKHKTEEMTASNECKPSMPRTGRGKPHQLMPTEENAEVLCVTNVQPSGENVLPREEGLQSRTCEPAHTNFLCTKCHFGNEVNDTNADNYLKIPSADVETNELDFDRFCFLTQIQGGIR